MCLVQNFATACHINIKVKGAIKKCVNLCAEKMDKTHIHIAPHTNNAKLKEPELRLIRRESEAIVSETKSGLMSVRAITFLLLWYFFSGCTLFLNKYILKYLNGNPWVLGTSIFSIFIQ